MTMQTTITLLAALLCLLTTSSAFTIPASSRQIRFGALMMSTEEDIPPSDDDDYKGEIDWDSEWKKVVQNKDQPDVRPGQGYYKSDVEVATIKVVNKGVKKVVKNIPEPPRIDTSDWRLWVGVLALISIATAVLSAPPQADMMMQGGGQDSYYI